MKRIMTSKKLFLLCLMALLLLSLAGCGEDEELPELGCTVDVLIDKDNFNDWEVGIPLRSPKYRSHVIAVPYYRAMLGLSESGVELEEAIHKESPELTKEYSDELETAWNILRATEEALEYVQKCEDEVWFDELFHVDRYTVAYHFGGREWEADEDGNITGAEGVFMIYDTETKGVEYLAFLEYTKNYISDNYGTILMLEESDETAE